MPYESDKRKRLGLNLEYRSPTIQEMLESGIPESCFIRSDTCEDTRARQQRESRRKLYRILFPEN